MRNSRFYTFSAWTLLLLFVSLFHLEARAEIAKIRLFYSKALLREHLEEEKSLRQAWQKKAASTSKDLHVLLSEIDRKEAFTVMADPFQDVLSGLLTWLAEKPAEQIGEEYQRQLRREVLKFFRGGKKMATDEKRAFSELARAIFAKLTEKWTELSDDQLTLIVTDQLFVSATTSQDQDQVSISIPRSTATLFSSIPLPDDEVNPQPLLELGIAFFLTHELGHWILENELDQELTVDMAGLGSGEFFPRHHREKGSHAHADLIGLALLTDLGYNPFYASIILQRLLDYLNMLTTAADLDNDRMPGQAYFKMYQQGAVGMSRRLGVMNTALTKLRAQAGS